MTEPRIISGRAVRERELRAGPVRVRFFEVLDVDEVLEAAIERSERPPYGAVPWASGIAAARVLAEAGVAGRTVVDVGAGCGVVSLTAAGLGARVSALDVDPLARSLLEAAATEQGLVVDVQAFDLLGTAPLPEGDLFVFADLLYEGPLAEATARRVLEAWARGSDVLVADPGRAGRETFELCLLEADVEASFEEVRVQLPGEEPVHKVGVFWTGPRGQGGEP